ncbi:uncharacterized protein [Solanum lycopersicum]|uniref:uncharacterized protein n=1 Tax=Solanum lycopersicum TaxID=4081 RepID=UPI0037479FF5
MVKDVNNRITLIFDDLDCASSKIGVAAMLIGYMDISKLMGSVAHGGSKSPACSKCGRNHSSICRKHLVGCFKRGQTGHFIRECPKCNQIGCNGGNRDQSSLVAPQDRVTTMGASSGTGRGTKHFYSLNNLKEQENSPDVVSGMIQVFDFAVYALLDPGASLTLLPMLL